MSTFELKLESNGVKTFTHFESDYRCGIDHETWAANMIKAWLRENTEYEKTGVILRTKGAQGAVGYYYHYDLYYKLKKLTFEDWSKSVNLIDQCKCAGEFNFFKSVWNIAQENK